jgi:hypothetical protein
LRSQLLPQQRDGFLGALQSREQRVGRRIGRGARGNGTGVGYRLCHGARDAGGAEQDDD